MAAPLGSILLASRDPSTLRSWYAAAFDIEPDGDGFLRFGGVGVLIDGRDDVADRAAEPARVILNFHVEDARATSEQLRELGAEVLVEPEWRGDAWFATLADPEGNWIQVIELSPAYFAARGHATSLARGAVATRLPAQDLERARAWYADKLGLHPVEERPGGLLYRCGDGEFALFASAGGPSGTHTQMSWHVDDIDAAAAELRKRGVVFADYDRPGMPKVDGIVEVPGNYPSRGRGERALWFTDSEGNLLGVGQSV